MRKQKISMNMANRREAGNRVRCEERKGRKNEFFGVDL